MNGIIKVVVLALAMTALPFAAQAADKAADKAGKQWPTFKKADADNSGNISMDEAKSAGLADSFSQYDKNGDGQLSRSEYESAKKDAEKVRSGEATTPGAQPGGPGTPPAGPTPSR